MVTPITFEDHASTLTTLRALLGVRQKQLDEFQRDIANIKAQIREEEMALLDMVSQATGLQVRFF